MHHLLKKCNIRSRGWATGKYGYRSISAANDRDARQIDEDRVIAPVAERETENGLGLAIDPALDREIEAIDSGLLPGERSGHRLE